MILGIDEVGRGCWAGPLVVGAVVLGEAKIDGLTDSKALSSKRRQQLAEQINQQAAVGLGWVEAFEIDDIGLSQALRLATKRAVKQIQAQKVFLDEIIIDGTVNFLSDTPLENYVSTLKKADLLISSVSAAAIAAKVARDEFMIKQAENFSGYGFENHVGYGTAAHRSAIEKFGPCELHRMSFAPLKKYKADKNSPTKKASSSKTTRAIGDASETAAAEELVRRGHKIIARNWKTKYCEIDIVSKKGYTYYFTEVKHRKNADYGDGLLAITPKKLNQMRYAAKFFAHAEELSNRNLQLLAIATSGDNPAVDTVMSID